MIILDLTTHAKLSSYHIMTTYCFCHDLLPVVVYNAKFSALLWHLSHDVW